MSQLYVKDSEENIQRPQVQAVEQQILMTANVIFYKHVWNGNKSPRNEKIQTKELQNQSICHSQDSLQVYLSNEKLL